MKTVWLQRSGRPRRLIFFAGWGMDDRPFQRLGSTEYDVCVCFDYRVLDVSAELRAACSGVDTVVVAWSFGCAAASAILAQGLADHVRLALAVNGTVTPEHDELGIPTQLLDATLANFDEIGWKKFVRRMCPGRDAREQFERNRPHRDLATLPEELQALRRLSGPAASPFTRALVGRRDKIIVPENQTRGWEKLSTPITYLDAPHYPFHLWQTWEEVLEAGEGGGPALT